MQDFKTKDCEKYSFETKESADHARRNINTRRNSNLTYAYRCMMCGKWHNTSVERTKKKLSKYSRSKYKVGLLKHLAK